jgi:hypoxanthine phosphoribosyltransferase
LEKLRVFLSREEIKDKVLELAAEIRKDYQGKNPLLVGILKGSFLFMADLVRALDMPLEIEFVRLSSYGSATVSSGKIKVVQGLKTPIKGRDILVIEDIVDTGITVRFLLDSLRHKKPASLKLCALFDKPSRRKVEVPIDYLGFTVPNEFLVGYGLDFNEKFRYFPDLYILEEA